MLSWSKYLFIVFFVISFNISIDIWNLQPANQYDIIMYSGIILMCLTYFQIFYALIDFVIWLFKKILS